MKIDEMDKDSVTLCTYNSDLNLIIDSSLYSAHPMTNDGFAYMWAGVRASHGASSGKFCFEVKILSHMDVSHLPLDEPNVHLVRVGFSAPPANLQLGECQLSYCYEGTGKFVSDYIIEDLGPPFQAGDVILAAVSIDDDIAQIEYGINGRYLGCAHRVPTDLLRGGSLFPHVLTRNVSFEVNFGQKDTPYYPLPDELKSYTFISCLPVAQRQNAALPPSDLQNCEVIMMCGLPYAGKTAWARRHYRLHPSKNYNILSTKTILRKMKVSSLPRKPPSHFGDWSNMIEMADLCLNKLMDKASKLKRNYILDQRNLYPCTRQMKMQNFVGFRCKAVVVVPSEKDYERRWGNNHFRVGKNVTKKALLEMKANFKLPDVTEAFHEIIYVELRKPEAEILVAKYNAEGRAATRPEGRAAVGPPLKKLKPDSLSSECGNDRILDPRRNCASSALGRNPQKDSEGDQSENFSWSILSGELDIESLDVDSSCHPQELRPLPPNDTIQTRKFGFPPAFAPNFVSDTWKELWSLPNLHMQPGTIQQLDGKGSKSSTCHADQDMQLEPSQCLDGQDSKASSHTVQDVEPEPGQCIGDKDSKNSTDQTNQDMQLQTIQQLDGKGSKSSTCHADQDMQLEPSQCLDGQDSKASSHTVQDVELEPGQCIGDKDPKNSTDQTNQDMQLQPSQCFKEEQEPKTSPCHTIQVMQPKPSQHLVEGDSECFLVQEIQPEPSECLNGEDPKISSGHTVPDIQAVPSQQLYGHDPKSSSDLESQ